MRLNVRTGRETLDAFAIRPAREVRRIMVIGGGPSGMEAARVAALRGHRVELWDDRPRLGGGCVWPPCRRTRRVTAKPATIWSAKSANWAWTSI